MKKLILSLLAALMCVSLVLSGCSKTISTSETGGGNHKADDIDDEDDGYVYGDDDELENTTKQPAAATTTEAETVPDAPETVPSTEKITEKATEKPTEAPTESATQKPVKETKSLGTSANGYSIEMIDGVVYVGGVIIANKTYSLPSDYNPGGLTSKCSAAFTEMQNAAAEEGLNIYVLSGFRSYELQDSLYSRYSASDGQAAADTYSARPGHSEHQTGLAMDVNSLSSSFAETAEGQWLAANSWKYGFILRYPADKVSKTGYIYEPWHFRYVGKDLAKSIFDSGLCLEEYFGITSVYA